MSKFSLNNSDRNNIAFKKVNNGILIMLTMFLMLFTAITHAQSTANYTFTTGTNASLSGDLNSNSIDMTTGATAAIGAGLDATATAVLNIGFDFYFMGSRFTQFSVQEDGILQLGGTAAVSTNTYTINGGTAALPQLAAFNADMRTGTTTGRVNYKVIGNAPNRVLVVEFFDMQLFYTSPGTAGTSRFQMRLYETTGVIEYVYGTMSATDVTTGNTAPSIGFYTGSATGKFASVAYATNTSSTTTPYAANPSIITTGVITNLNAAADGSRTYYRYTPSAPIVAPSGLGFASVTSNSMTLNWTASSPVTNVQRYVIFNSSDGGTTYNFVNTVTVGTNTLAVTGLVPGTLYLWKVYSVNEGAFSTASASGSQSTAAAATYTWSGAVSSSYIVAGNWSPNRGTPAITDILLIDGNITAAPAITAFATQTIGQLIVKNSANATLTPSANAILTISGGAGTDLDIQNGSTLNLGGTVNITLNFTGTQTATIAGTLKTSTTGTGTLTFTNATTNVTGTLNISATVNANASTAANLSFAAGATCIMGSNSVVIPVATWATTSNLNVTGVVAATTVTNGAQSFGNLNYNSSGSTGIMGWFVATTTGVVKGDLNIQATGSGRLRLLTSGTLAVNGSMNVTAGNFDLINGAATLTITGSLNVSNAATGNFANGAGTISIGGNVTLSNAASLNIGNAGAANTTTITGSLNLNSSGTTVLSATSGTTNILNVNGDFNISNGTFSFGTTAGGGTLKVKGNFTQTGGAIGLTGTATTGNVEFNGTSAQNVTFTSALTGLVSVRLNNAAGINLSGPLAINNGASYTVSAGTTTGSGPVTYNATASKLVYNGTALQTANSLEFPASNGPVSLTINNTATAPNNVVAASFSRTLGIAGILTLTAGVLDINGNSLTITNTAATAVTGGSTTSWVKGMLIRSLPASLATGTTYTFPVGKSGYNGFDLVNPTTNAGGPLTIQTEVFDANSGGTPGLLMASLNTGRYWAASITSGSTNFTNSLIRLNDTRGTLDGIASGATLTGAYDHVGGAVSTTATGSITTTAPAATSIPGFFAMGNLAAATLTSLAITPAGNQCTNVARSVTVTATPGAAAVTSVTLNYNVNGVAQTGINMTNTSGNDWSGTIPTVTPPTATVTWTVTATDANSLTKTATGTSYTDAAAFGISASATATVTSLCAGQPSSLSVVLVKGGTFTLGAGATTSINSDNSSGISVSPFSHYYGGYKCQYVIRSTELTALSMPAGNITKMAFNVTSAGTTYSGFTIKIANTTATTASNSTFTTGTGTQTVFSGNYTPAVGINDIVFTTPFTWNGTSNLLIEICWSNNNGGGIGLAAEIKYDAAAFNAQDYYREDNVDPSTMCSEISPEQRQTNRPQIRFTVNNAPAPTAYSWSDGASVVGTTNPLTVNPMVSNSYTATVTVLGCPVVSNAVSITAIALPASPNGNNSVQCGVGVPTCFVTTGGGGGGFKWYSAQTGGTLLQNGGGFYTTSISSTQHFWVSESNGTCESPRTEVIATVNTPDPLSATSTGPVCANTSLQLTATVTSGSNGNNYTFVWTATPATGSGIPTTQAGGTGTFGSPSSTNITPTVGGTYTYTVTGTDGACTAVATLVMTIKALPQINSTTATPSTVCAGTNVTLNGTTGTQAAGTVVVGAGASTQAGFVTTGNEGFGNPYNYWYGNQRTQYIYTAAELNALGMSAGNITALSYETTALGSTPYSLTGFTITMGTTAQSAATSTIITSGLTTVYTNANQPITLGINNYVFSSPFAWNGTSNIVVTVCWGNSTSGDNSNVATVKYDVVPFVSTRVVYTDGSIGTGICASTSGSRNDLVSNRPRTRFAAVSGVNTTGSMNWSWNPGALTGSTVIVTPSATTIYTVTATDPVTTCSATNTVTVTVYPLPPAPSATNGTDQCGTGLSDMTVSSNNTTDAQAPPFFKWYDAPTGGTLKQSGTSATYTTPISATTTLYVSEVSSHGCEGLRSLITSVVSDPDLLTVSATHTNVCLGSSTDISSAYTPDFNSFATYTLTALPLSGSGTSGPVTLTPNGSGDGSDPFTVTPTATGTYTYTITAIDPDKGCTAANTVSVTVAALPLVTSATATPATVCAGASVSLLANSIIGGSGNSVSIGSGTGTTAPTDELTAFCNRRQTYQSQAIFTAAELSAAGLTAGNITAIKYNIISVGDASSTSNFTVKIANTASSALTAFVTTGFSTVFGPVTYNHAVGLNTITFATPYAWDGVSNIVIDITNGGIDDINNAETYYTTTVANMQAYAYNGSTTATLTTSRLNVIFSGFMGTDNTGLYSWVWNPGNIPGNSVTVNPAVTTTYTATATRNGCSVNSAPVTVTVNPLPNQPVAHPSTQCGVGVPAASVTTGGANGTYTWYSAATGGTVLQSGGAAYTSAISVPTHFWVSETGAICESVRTDVFADVTTAPAITPVATVSALCLGASVGLSVSSPNDPNYTYTWSATPAGSGLINGTTGNPGSVTPTVAGTFTYTVTAGDAGSGCNIISAVTVTANANPVVDSIKVGTAIICNGGSSILNVYSGVVTSGPQTPPSGYAASSADESTDEDILNVTFGTLNNTSTCSTTGGGSSVLNEYSDYTGLVAAPVIVAGQTVPLSVQIGTCNGTFDNWTNVFIDYNRNGLFEESERVYTSPSQFTGAHTETANIVIPSSLTPGLTLMRVMVQEFGSNEDDPESIYDWGETEDYLVNLKSIVTQNPALTYTWNPGGLSGSTVTVSPATTTSYTATVTNSATGCFAISTPVTVTVSPVAAAPTANPATAVCAGTTVTLKAHASGGAPFTYSWSDGTNVVGTANTITVNPLITTTYTVTVTDVCGSAATGTVTVTVNPLPTAAIQEGPGPLAICAPASQALHAVTNAGSATYQWTLNGTNIPGATLSAYTVSAVGSGTYRVIVTNTVTTCISAASAGVVVTINIQPAAVTITPVAPAICDGAVVALTAAGGTVPVATVATLGTGTTNSSATATGTNLGPDPFQNVFGGAKQQMLYTAAELTTLGMTAGSQVSAIAINMFAVGGSPAALSKLKVKVQHTALTALTTTMVTTGWTNVFGFSTPASITPVTGFNTIIFDNAFTWNGTSNLLIEINYSNQNSGSGSTNRAIYGTTTNVSTSFYRANNATTPDMDAYTGAASFTYSSRNNTRFSFTVPTATPFTWASSTGLFTTAAANIPYTGAATPTVYAKPSITSTYTATATSAAGCINSNTVAVTVNPRPTGVITGGATYCAGQGSTATTLSIAVTGTGPWNGTLSPGAIPFSGSSSPITVSVTPSSTTTYTIATLNGSQCSSIAADLTGSATVTVNPVPATPTISPAAPTAQCGGTVTLTSSSATGNQWNLEGSPISGAANQTLVVSASGNYSVTVTNGFGCSATSAVTAVTINPVPATPTITPAGPVTQCGGTVTLTSSSATNNQWNLNGSPIGGATNSTLVVSASGDYTVTVTNVFGCSATSAITTVTVNPLPATPAISPAGPVTQCGGTVTLTASSPGQWQWNLNGSPVSGAINQTLVVSASGNYSVTVTNEFGCSATSTATSVTINPVPATPTISAGGPIVFCAGGSVTLTSSSATGNQWNLNGSPTGGATNSTLVVTASGDYTVTVTNAFGCSATSAITTVTVNPLAANPIATVVQPTCALGTGTINVTSPLGGGNTYSLDGINFQSGPSFPGQAPGTYTVYVHNAAGCFSPATTNVTVNLQPFIPAAPVITGTVNVCPFIGVTGTAGQVTYHATATGNGTTTFNWVIPPTLVTIISGQGTADITVSFQNGFSGQANKQLRVTAANQCGTGPMTIYYLAAQTPTTPNPVVGPTDACPLLGGPAVSYTIPKAPGAASYAWSVPQSGTGGTTVIHPNGAGPNDTTILVSFLPAYTTGTITVQSVNSCGVSGTRSITVTRISPSQPNIISGPTNACPYITPNTTATYTVPAVPGVTYQWTANNGAILSSAQDSNTMTVSYPVGYTSGTITVTAGTGCGTSAPRTLTITTLNPATPGIPDIIQTHLCGEPGGRKYTYTLSSMPSNATSLLWTVPAGATYANLGPASIEVTYPDAAVNGVITIQAVNPCANSVVRSVNVKLPACPAGFAGINNGTNGTAESKGTVKAAEVTHAPVVAGSMDVKIFPNPTVSDFKLEVLTAGTEEITVRVLDNLGRLYKNFKVMPYQTIALGAELKAGSYLVEVRQGKTVKTTKVIKF